MSKRVLKYPLNSPVSHLVLPRGAQLLHAKEQGDTLVLYALVEERAPRDDEERVILSINTGVEIPDGKTLAYVATVQVRASQRIVWHVFEVLP